MRRVAAIVNCLKQHKTVCWLLRLVNDVQRRQLRGRQHAPRHRHYELYDARQHGVFAALTARLQGSCATRVLEKLPLCQRMIAHDCP